MGNITLETAYTNGQIIDASHINELTSALLDDFMGRDSTGTPTTGKNLGTASVKWGNAYLQNLIADAIANVFCSGNFDLAKTLDSTTTGSNQTLAHPGKGILRITNASLVSVSAFSGFGDCRTLVLINDTGASVTIKNNSSISTGTGSDLSLANGACLYLLYESVSAKVRIIGGAGGGGVSAWATGKAYVAGDIVETNNKLYKCLTGHTSGTFATDLAASKWIILNSDIADLTGGPLPISKGGTGSATQNFVDLSTNQTIAGTKTFSSTIVGNINGNAATVTTVPALTGDVTTNGSTNATTIGAGKVTNAMLAGSIDLTTKVTGILPIANGGTGSANLGTGFVKAASGVLSVVTSINAASDLTGITPIANGGTGSATQNFVDLSTGQTVGGAKSFSAVVTFGTSGFKLNDSVGTPKAATFIAPAAFTNNHTYTLPNDKGDVGQAMRITDTGVLFWDDFINDNELFNLDGTHPTSYFGSGNNATFLGGGTLAGTLVRNTTTTIAGIADYKYTQAAGSLNDYVYGPIKTVTSKFQGPQFFTFDYKYDGLSTDILMIVYDISNGRILTTATDFLLASPTVIKQAIPVTIPSDCAQLRVAFHVKTLNSGKIFQFKNMKITSDLPFGFTNVSNDTDWISYTPTAPATVTLGNGTQLAKYRRIGDSYQIRYQLNVGSTTSLSAGAVQFQSVLPSGVTIDTTKLNSGIWDQVGYGYYFDTSANTHYTGALRYDTGSIYLTVQGSNVFNPTNPVAYANGDVINIDMTVPIVGKSVTNPSVVTPIQQVSSDTMGFVFKSTAIDPNTDPVGTFNTFAYTSSSNTNTIQTSAPTQTTSDMNTNGFKVFTRAFNAASTSGNPARVQIFLGKGLKNVNVQLYKNTGKSVAAAKDFYYISSTQKAGLNCAEYDETSGILTLDAGYDGNGSSTSSNFLASDNTQLTSAYVVINASRTPSIAAIPLLRKVATIKDVKSSGTNGGTFTSGSYVTRTLNTLNDPFGIVTSLSSNQFILPAGKYHLRAIVPAFETAHHKAKLKNITDSTDTIIGSSASVTQAATVGSDSIVEDVFTITAPKTFEIQHRCSTTESGDGLGWASSFGDSEVYTNVIITKLD